MNIDFSFYIKLFWRRLPVMIFFIVACSVVSLLTAFRLPDTFSTSARLLVEAPQIVLDSATVQTDAVEQLEIIEQKLLTRVNLLEIARKYDVFEDMSQMNPDQIVEMMTEATRIQRRAGRNRATLMTISFKGRTARIVSNVVNEFVTVVLDENSDTRTLRAENTREFFDTQVERLSVELDERSTNIAIFKTQNAEALPEDQSFRLQRQAQLIESMTRAEREIAALKTRREEVVRLFENSGIFGTAPPQAVQRSEEERLLIARQADLEVLRATYTDENPRVRRVLDQIERLQAIVNAQVSTTDGVETEGLSATEARDKAIFDSNVAQIDSTIAFQEEELSRMRTDLEVLQGAIRQSSSNGVELSNLEREYEIVLARYNAAVVNLNTAQMDEVVETTAQGQRIAILENANTPSEPSGPDRPKIAIAGGAFGFLLAGGYFVLLEFLNRNVRRPAELVSRFNVTPITTIPYMESRGRRFARRAGSVFATLAVLIGVPALLFYIDTNYLPLELVVERGLRQLGLG